MDNTHQAKVKNGHVLHKIALVQSQRNSTVHLSSFSVKFQNLFEIYEHLTHSNQVA